MKFILFILCLGILFLGSLVKANAPERVRAGFDLERDLISENYDAGAFLIYDCLEGHWTCVSQTNFEECEKKRTDDLAADEIISRCAPIGEFKTKKSCFQRQLFMVSHNHGASVCALGRWRAKEIIYR